MPSVTTPQKNTWHFTEYGHGKPLLLLHGWSFDKSIWSYQIDEFARDFSLITLDLPGHGESTLAANSDIVSDLYHVVCALRRQKINIIGHSFGGFLALQFAAQYADVVEKLVVVGAPAKFARSESYPYGLTTEQIDQLRAFLERDYPKILEVFMRWLFSAHERTQSNFKTIWEQIVDRPQWPDKGALDWILQLIVKADAREQVRKISAYTLIINGSHDQICSKAAAAYLHDHLDHSRIEFFNNCGHLPFLTHPDDFNRLVKTFLKGL